MTKITELDAIRSITRSLAIFIPERRSYDDPATYGRYVSCYFPPSQRRLCRRSRCEGPLAIGRSINNWVNGFARGIVRALGEAERNGLDDVAQTS